MITKVTKEEFMANIFGRPRLDQSYEVEQKTLARDIAIFAHKDQVRSKGIEKGSAYINHPMRVAATFPFDWVMFSAATLHDVIEDTEFTSKDLLDMGVDASVVGIVNLLSKKPGQNYLDFILGVRTNAMAEAVKIADIKDNMATLEEGTMKDKYRLSLYILQETP